MKKRIASVLLALILAVGILPGAAAVSGGLFNFTSAHTYKSGHFTDVATSKWYAPYIQAAYEFGLFSGTSDSTFTPDAKLTIGEAVKLAACLHSIYNTGTADFAESEPWFDSYVDYALKNGIISSEYSDYDADATRSEFSQILAKSLPTEALAVKNTVEYNAIPDVPASYGYAQSVYELYRAGVLTGSDASGRFLPNNDITRAEVAAIVVRMADAAFRQTVTLNLDLTSEQIFDQCSPAVFFVRIYDIKDTPIKTGSGFFIDESGLAVTNFHVLSGGARAVITTSDGKEYDVAGVCDYNKDMDLALIKINGGGFQYLRKADSSAVMTGADAWAIGSPLGFKNTISKGIISSAVRVVGASVYIQTTAAISSGSSGGALLDSSGRVIGVTTATANGAQNINLAVPINSLKDFNTTTLSTLQSILPDTKFYSNLYPAPDFGAYAGASVFQLQESSLQSTYFYRVSDLPMGEDKALDGYTALLGDNCFTFYGYAIENGRIITYYTNSAYRMLLTFGTVQLNDTVCIRVQIMDI